MLPTVETLPDPRLRLAPNPQLSGQHGGRDVNLREMAAHGITLLGHLDGVEGGGAGGVRLAVRPDLTVSLARADAFFDERLRPAIDKYIAGAGIDAPPDDRRPVTYAPPEVESLDLDAAEIRTIVWATGYRLDYGWLDFPILDEQGIPRQRRGVSEVPGLYFLGLLWQSGQASATLFGPTVDIPPLAAAMGLAADEAAATAVGGSSRPVLADKV
jgi:putative flavoprotein involved in K+ transport